MRIFVSIKTHSKLNKVEEIDSTHFNVWVSVPPIDNKANETIVELLSAYLDTPKTSITIKLGQTSKRKVFEIR